MADLTEAFKNARESMASPNDFLTSMLDTITKVKKSRDESLVAQSAHMKALAEMQELLPQPADQFKKEFLVKQGADPKLVENVDPKTLRKQFDSIWGDVQGASSKMQTNLMEQARYARWAGNNELADSLTQQALQFSQQQQQMTQAQAPTAFQVATPGQLPEEERMRQNQLREQAALATPTSSQNTSVLPSIPSSTRVGGMTFINPNAQLSQSTKDELSKLSSQKDILGGMKELLSNPMSGPILGNLAKGIAASTGGQFQTDIKTYSDFKNAIAAGIYRGITGDTRLSDEDARSRAYPLLPDPADSKKLQDRKMNFLQTILDRRFQSLSTGKEQQIPLSTIMKEFKTQLNQKPLTFSSIEEAKKNLKDLPEGVDVFVNGVKYTKKNKAKNG